MSHSLTERLKTETRALHTAAERTAFMNALLRGRMARPAYCALLRNLHAIYAALEPALDRHALHPTIAPILLAGLQRTRAIEHDLHALHGPGWSAELSLQSATRDYVARLADIEARQPDLLLAHAYVRYLGDLSGGQMLRGIVAGSIAPPDSRATAFYEFGDATQTQELTRLFRAGLAEVAVDSPGEDALVSEARRAFEMHQRLFDELAHDWGMRELPVPR